MHLQNVLQKLHSFSGREAQERAECKMLERSAHKGKNTMLQNILSLSYAHSHMVPLESLFSLKKDSVKNICSRT